MSVLLRDDVLHAINDVINQLNFIIASIPNDSSLKSKKEKIELNTDIQTCINYKFKNNLETNIQKILIDYCFKAERFSPGGFKKTLDLIEKLSKKNLIDENDNNVVCYPTLNDLEKIIPNFCNNDTISKICFEAIKLCGFAGKISIEKSLNSISSIEMIDGYSFFHEPNDNLSVKLIKPQVLCIDGYIESVSEINLLFEGAVELKHPLVLITRGMHDDVINTIKVNKNRGTMFVYPIKIPFDISGINTIVDISTVIGRPAISCDLGQLISSTTINDSIQVDEIMISSNSLLIKNPKTRNNVNVHVKNLIEKMNKSVEDIESLLSSRIKSLSGNHVVIRLPDDANYIQKSQMIDYVLRSIKSMLDFGIIINHDENIELYGSYQIAKQLAKKFHDIVSNINAFLD